VQQRFGALAGPLPTTSSTTRAGMAAAAGGSTTRPHRRRRGASSSGGGDPRILSSAWPDGTDPGRDAPRGRANYHAIRVRRGARLQALSLGTCRPVLSDGCSLQAESGFATIGRPTTWDAVCASLRNNARGRAAFTHMPSSSTRADGRLAALCRRAREPTDLPGHVRRASRPGARELACLADRRATVPTDPAPRTRDDCGSSRRARCGRRPPHDRARPRPRFVRAGRVRPAPRPGGEGPDEPRSARLVIDDLVAGEGGGGIRIAPCRDAVGDARPRGVKTFVRVLASGGGAKAGLIVPEGATAEERERRTAAPSSRASPTRPLRHLRPRHRPRLLASGRLGRACRRRAARR